MALSVPDPIFVLRQEAETFHCLSFASYAGVEYLLSGSENGKVHKWDLTLGRSVPSSTINVGASTCLSLHHIPDSNSLIVQDKSGQVTFWKDNTIVSKIILDYFGFCKTVYFQPSDLLICPREKSSIQVISNDTREEIDSLTGDGKIGDVMSFKAITRDQQTYIICAFESGDILVWNLKTRTSVCRLTLDNFCPMSLDYEVKHDRGIVVGSTDKLFVFRFNDESITKRHEMTMNSEGASCAKFRPDGRVFAVGCWDGRVRLFDSKRCRRLAVLDFHNQSILDVAFSSRVKSLLAVTAKDGKISVWDICN